MNFQSVVKIAFLVVMALNDLIVGTAAQDRTAMKPGPCTPCEGAICLPTPICADNSQPFIYDCCLRCASAVISDCVDINCVRSNECPNNEYIWLTNECCPICKYELHDDTTSVCSNVSCFKPIRICRRNETPLPLGACCPICNLISDIDGAVSS